MKNILKNKVVQFVVALIFGLLLGWVLFGGSSNSKDEAHVHETESLNEVWTCSMHPQIRKSESGDCPICGMDLIPLGTDDNSDENPNAIKMSPTAMQLANVQTVVVQLGAAVRNLNLTGTITPDERAVFSQTSHISGRIEKLTVNYTGESVRMGQVIATLYSPELVTAQEELLIAFENKETQPELLIASKEKLRNWKLTEGQINQLIESGKPMDEFPILSDLTGVVITKFTNRGDHIKEGEAFYELADLSSLWVLLDVHESDLAWINEGNVVQYSVKAYPTKNFTGKVDFIDPTIDPKTRVAKARIELDNSDKIFKPQMLVNATVESKLKSNNKAMIVPKSAVMWTGERSLVYVKTNAESGLHFIMREVVLGASLGDTYIINSGLEAGEEIAVNGTFSIDAAAQLAGKPSMMNPEGGTSNTGHNHGSMKDDGKNNPTKKGQLQEFSIEIVKVDKETKKALVTLFVPYLKLKDALTEDDFKRAKTEVENVSKALAQVNMRLFKNKAHKVWMKYSVDLKRSVEQAKDTEQIEQLRESFITISSTIIQLNATFQPLDFTVYVQHCPMANSNTGADWISKEEEIKNPYFGSSMLSCGEIKSN
jgi:Cu(I)/Ag(I) efflux system membrane fusion protein